MHLVEEVHVAKEAKDNERKTAFHYASEFNCIDIGKYIIEEAYIDISGNNDYGRTILHFGSVGISLDVF